MDETGRGVTNWEGTGAYTKENTEILYVVISKYEVNQIKRIVQESIKRFFMIFTEGTAVTGNFEKRLYRQKISERQAPIFFAEAFSAKKEEKLCYI